MHARARTSMCVRAQACAHVHAHKACASTPISSAPSPHSTAISASAAAASAHSTKPALSTSYARNVAAARSAMAPLAYGSRCPVCCLPLACTGFGGRGDLARQGHGGGGGWSEVGGGVCSGLNDAPAHPFVTTPHVQESEIGNSESRNMEGFLLRLTARHVFEHLCMPAAVRKYEADIGRAADKHGGRESGWLNG
eukprot:365963-Chlamydomonas_euryale.AAC.3